MNRILTISTLIILVSISFTATAQHHSSAGASQQVQLRLLPAIGFEEILDSLAHLGHGNNGHGNGNGNGNNGNGNGNGHGNGNGNGHGNKYASGNGNGTQSENAKQFRVRSNKNFIISVQTDVKSASDNNNVYLALETSTTGRASKDFSKASYTHVSYTSQELLTNCNYGNDQRFAVNYKSNAHAAPVDIIYTATQP